MRKIFRSRRALAVALGTAFASAVAVSQPVSAQAPRERTMFVSAVDQKGEPVGELGPNDFVIREDGAAREVLRVSHATEPIDIAILVLGGIGYAVDKWQGTAPWGLIIGLALGMIVGFYDLIKTTWRP